MGQNVCMSLDFLDDIKIEPVPAYQCPENEIMLLSFDATSIEEYPEDGSFGYLYLLLLSAGWIKVGLTTQWCTRRRRALYRQIGSRHQLEVLDEWRTPPMLADDLRYEESRVKAYARCLADSERLRYHNRGRLREETEMFHGVDFGMVRAFADVIGRCAVAW